VIPGVNNTCKQKPSAFGTCAKPSLQDRISPGTSLLGLASCRTCPTATIKTGIEPFWSSRLQISSTCASGSLRPTSGPVCLLHKPLPNKSCSVGLSERAGHKYDLFIPSPKNVAQRIIHCEDGCTIFFGRTAFFLTSKIKIKQTKKLDWEYVHYFSEFIALRHCRVSDDTPFLCGRLNTNNLCTVTG